MQISRIATIVAAGVITPALFLATPAVAEELPATAGQTTTQQGGGAVAPADTNTAPKADTNGNGTTPFDIPVTVQGLPKKIQAGTGDWSQFEMSFDNRKGDKDAVFRPHAIYIPVKPDADKAADYALKLEYRKGQNGEWKRADMSVGKIESEKEGRSFTLSRSLGEYPVSKGEMATFELRLLFEKQTPAHKAHFRVVDEHNVASMGDQEFSVLAAKAKDPQPSKSATTSASPSATATASGKATASPKPSTSAGASASASPSASSSSSAAVDSSSGSGASSGGTTATGSRTELAATGSDPATPWIAAGGAVAIVAGAGLVVATRRRANARG
ncbi:LAETG motif-containing sortase-dependent surface protein [Streptomyces hesseae]|uniref:LAETG motif-containing sortase-dependent surface protein n=1 Tax=Streptomyces hesseae TaxID=3075519 RepID=A0ABU2SNF2_9ACTN|nr:LAETG motif-containing sortase-dependent surface protein [Streptomyces sp. DSM 40473]MDT0450512.1 LAETG motif-containing sortase-dependent surface protein [Streptomyces sp. DSM 40473]